MNTLDKQYQTLLQDIIDNGVAKQDRTGTGTISVFGRQIRHKMSEGFSLLTTKKMAWKTMVTELLWFLRGDTSIEYLLKNDCNIWTGDAYKNYLNKRTTANKDNVREPHTLANGMTGQIYRAFTQEEFIDKIKTDDEFAKKWASLGKIYGYQWRNWNGEIDQISELIRQLKDNPDSRRLLVSAWNASDLPHQVLPPCHYGFQVYTRELSLDERLEIGIQKLNVVEEIDESDLRKYIEDSVFNMTRLLNDGNIPTRAISLMFNMRSNDVPLGLPFNIASYGLLLEILSKMVNMVPDELIANLGDAHIYKNQIEGVKEQISRTPYELPQLIISDRVNFNGTIDEFLESCDKDSFKLDGYESHPSIKIPLSN